MSNPLARKFLLNCFMGWYRPRSKLTPWQWHEEQRTQLGTTESQDYAGPYDSSLAPQNRFFMEFASGKFSENIEFDPSTPADAVWRECVIMKSSQVGVTLSILLVMVWWIAEVGKNIIYAIDSEGEARRICRARLQPLIKACRGAHAKMNEGAEGMNALTLYLLGVVVYMLGGYSLGGWQNKTSSLAVIDEADFHPQPEVGQPSNVDEARSRLKGVADAKLYVISKPKTEEHITAKEYAGGTQHKCFVPCPHCDAFQELVWENVRFDHCKNEKGDYDLQRVKDEAFYECDACHQKIEEKHKRSMLMRHRWRQTNPKPDPGKISAHISDLYSQFASSKWGVLAAEYVVALKSITKMTAFRVNRLGKPSRLQSSQRSLSDIYDLRQDYPKGSIPVMPVLMAMSSDVQGDVRKWVRGGFTREGDLYIVDYGYTLALDELYEIALEAVPVGMDRTWPTKKKWEGAFVEVEQGIIDEGHIATEVRRFCLRTDGVFVPAKGRGGIQVRRTVNESTAEIDGEELSVYHFDDDDFKKQLFISRIAQDAKIKAGKVKGPRLILPWDIDGEFAAELTSEKLTYEKDNRGFSREKWEKNPDIPNDFGDAVKMLLVTWYVLGPEILAELDAADAAAAKAEAAKK